MFLLKFFGDHPIICVFSVIFLVNILGSDNGDTPKQVKESSVLVTVQENVSESISTAKEKVKEAIYKLDTKLNGDKEDKSPVKKEIVPIKVKPKRSHEEYLKDPYGTVENKY